MFSIPVKTSRAGGGQSFAWMSDPMFFQDLKILGSWWSIVLSVTSLLGFGQHTV